MLAPLVILAIVEFFYLEDNVKILYHENPQTIRTNY